MSYVMSTVIAGFCVISHGLAQANEVPQSKQLTDVQLDRVAAGLPVVSATGDGTATGQLATAETNVTAIARTGGSIGSTASGQVTAVGVSSAGALASASSHLSLTFSSFP